MTTELDEHLTFLYGREAAGTVGGRLAEMMERFREAHPGLASKAQEERLSERDAILITYGDMVQAPGEAPLHTLATFLEGQVGDLLSTVHLLPFFPYSSDDGFAVIDYRAVDPQLGSWEDVACIGQQYRLMFDAVINHISASSRWFQGFLANEVPYRDYFMTVAPDSDLSQVFRPRALPLLTPVETAAGKKWVWTTFSRDQPDLNYHNPAVLLAIVETILFYVGHGADFIRLDAIAFMWKEIGTSCIHLPQTHRIIQLLRAVLDRVAPHVVLITETNVPHEENVSYFGNGQNEAQMVYNFSLPPLTLHAFHTGQAETLSRWASTLETPSAETTFFNFLASHDGIGLTPAKGILSEGALAAMAARVQALGGRVSYKNNADGSQSPYELNISYLNALGDPEATGEGMATVVRRFLTSQAIMLALQGVPGIYFHSLFGSRNWEEGIAKTGRFRSINREKLTRARLVQELADPGSLRRQVFNGYRRLLKARRQPVFHPNAAQEILFLDEALFSMRRQALDGRGHILCLHNVSAHPVRLTLDLAVVGMPTAAILGDQVEDAAFPVVEGQCSVGIPPYGTRWLRPYRTTGEML